MRFYHTGWVDEIIRELKYDSKLLLCCQTKALHLKDGKLIEDAKRPVSYGAYIGLDKSLDAEWIWDKNEFPNVPEDGIPCVLGAAYASSKEYWQYLKGLDGLISYGSDEVYISLKVWLEGGRCKLLEDIEVGHIYRKEFPYQVETIHTTYNKLLIAETLLPLELKKQLFRKLKSSWKEIYGDAYALFYKNAGSMERLKQYYQQIFTKDFDFVLQLNRNKDQIRLSSEEKEKRLRQIARHIALHSCSTADIGLFYGRMGHLLFLYHYAKYAGDVVSEELAGYLLDDLCKNLNTSLPVNMESGYCGIAWGIAYLMRHGFVEGDPDEVLEDLDKKIMERDPKRISDWTFDRGLAGILFYVSTRLMFAEENNRKSYFDPEYLTGLADKVREVLSLPDFTKQDDADILLEYSAYILRNQLVLHPIGLSDFICVRIPAEEELERMPSGLLNGSAGMGLNMLFFCK